MIVVRWWVPFVISVAVVGLATAFALPWWSDVQARYHLNGPTLWDSASMMAGLAMGTLLRVGLGRGAPSRIQALLMVTLLMIFGLLTFLPWSADSLVRVLLPLGALATATWGFSGARRSVNR